MSRTPVRIHGYAPIRDYAVIGDGRVVALVALDGAIDWLCLPTLDAPRVFGALLDAEQGGAFRLEPDVPYAAERRYRGSSNVLETTFTTADGAVRVTDAVNLHNGAALPWREVARRVEGLGGSVPMRFSVEPRFGYGQAQPDVGRTNGVPVARAGSDMLGVFAWDAGEARCEQGAIRGAFTATEGSRALLALSHTTAAPLMNPQRDAIEARLDETVAAWERRASELAYDGPWRDAVLRSALVLELLTTPAGAIAAAPTMGLPERIGGPRNFDYRYAWVRDSSFALDALLSVGMRTAAHASYTWLLQASATTHPRLQPMYTLDGSPQVPDGQLSLSGYRASEPVELGNGAAGQLQLGNFGDFLDTTWRYARDGHELDEETGRRVADVADLVCAIWRHDDSGIWELQARQRPYTFSKIGCWVALERTLDLARDGQVPARHVATWERERDAIRSFVEERCWSQSRQSYAFFAGSDELDASTLLAARAGYADAPGERMLSTIRAIREELGRGPLLYRYSDMVGKEGAFLACSFWLVEALARCERLDEAHELMDDLVALANDVGLYSEEMDPETHEMLGNFPQGLTHLALIVAARLYAEARAGQ